MVRNCERRRETKERRTGIGGERNDTETTEIRQERNDIQGSEVRGEGSENQRIEGRQERTESQEREEFANVLRSLEEEFAEKERLSQGQLWCVRILQETKVSTVEQFYTAFHDVYSANKYMHGLLPQSRKVRVGGGRLASADESFRWAASFTVQLPEVLSRG